MLLKLLASASFLVFLLGVVLTGLDGFSVAYVALALNGLVGFALLNALGDIVNHLETIATNTKK